MLNSELPTCLLYFQPTAGACNCKRALLQAFLEGVGGFLSPAKDRDFRTQYRALGLADKECIRGSACTSVCVGEGLGRAC